MLFKVLSVPRYKRIASKRGKDAWIIIFRNNLIHEGIHIIKHMQERTKPDEFNHQGIIHEPVYKLA